MIAHWQAGGVTAWANFQGPFTLHGVAAAALGIPGAKLRLLTPSESGGSFGTKAAVLHAVVLMAIASRCLGVPVRWTEDRSEHLLAASMATERTSEVEAAFDADGRLLGLRLDLIDEVGAYVRAPEPATLYRMHGCLTGAYDVQDLAVRSRVVRQQSRAVGPQPRLRRAAALQRARAHDAHRRPAARDRPGRARAPQSRAGRARCPTAPRPARSTTRATTRPASTARSSWRATTSCAPSRRAARGEGRLLGIGLACVVEPSVSNMGYITLVQTRRGARGRPAQERQRRGRHDRDGRRTAASRCASRPRRRARATAPWRHRSRPTSSASSPSRSTCAPMPTRPPIRGRCRPATTRAASRRWAPPPCISRRRGSPIACARSRRRCSAARRSEIELAGGVARVRGDAERSVPIRRLAGAAHWHPSDLTGEAAEGLALTVTYTLPISPPDDDDRVNSSACYGFIADVCAVEIDPETAEIAVRSYVTVHDAGRLLNPLLADGQIRGGLAHGLGAALLEEHR